MTKRTESVFIEEFIVQHLFLSLLQRIPALRPHQSKRTVRLMIGRCIRQLVIGTRLLLVITLLRVIMLLDKVVQFLVIHSFATTLSCLDLTLFFTLSLTLSFYCIVFLLQIHFIFLFWLLWFLASKSGFFLHHQCYSGQLLLLFSLYFLLF